MDETKIEHFLMFTHQTNKRFKSYYGYWRGRSPYKAARYSAYIPYVCTTYLLILSGQVINLFIYEVDDSKLVKAADKIGMQCTTRYDLFYMQYLPESLSGGQP